MAMTDAELDARILLQARPQYLKVARVLGLVLHECDSKGIEVSNDKLQGRLDALIAAGTLEAAGNVSNWRHSEVRLPP